MLTIASHSWWKDRKKERLQKRFEKLVNVVRGRHNKLVQKGCTFAKIYQNPSVGEHFVNHGKMCESMGAYIKGTIYYVDILKY